METNEIYKAFGRDYKAMTRRLLERAELASLIGRRDARIGIKPNLVVPTPALFGATTHPEIMAGIVEYLQEAGFANLSIVEGSWVGDRTEEAFEYCGYNALAREYGVRLIDGQTERAMPLDCAGQTLRVCECVRDIDFLINVPVLKGHCQTRMTCALKNLKGLLPNSEKRRFHSLGLHRPIAHLNAGIRQDFIVVDHICGDPDYEEGGNPLERNCVMVARDPVLTDCYGCTLLGLEPEDVAYIPLAAELGVGSMDLSTLRVRVWEGEDTESVPESRRLIDLCYAAEDVQSCSACRSALTEALDRLRSDGVLDRLDVPVSVGQGFRGKSGILGVGSCTAGFDANVPGCPPSAEDIYRFLAARLGV